MVIVCITPVPGLPLYIVAEVGDGFMLSSDGLAVYARTVGVVWDNWLCYTNN